MKVWSHWDILAAATVVLGVALLVAGCGDSNGGGPNLRQVKGQVVDGDGGGIAGVTVYLVPTDSIDMTPITAQGVLDGTTEGFDEPLEDAVANQGATFPRTVTDEGGNWILTVDDGIVTNAKYYFFVKPAADSEFLPGGGLSRIAQRADTFLGTEVSIRLSSSPPVDATFVGSSTCMSCHAEGQAGLIFTAHKLGFSAMGQLGPLQDARNFPHYTEALEQFPWADRYDEGKVLTYGDYTAGRSFDKFKLYEGSSPSKIDTIYAHAYLWRDNADSQYKITLVNELNPGDPSSPLTLTPKLTYGGTVYKQRFLVPYPGRKGKYPFLQYQSYPGISDGTDSHYDRTRAVWRDYHLDWFWSAGDDGEFGTGDDTFKDPPLSKNFEANCVGCHFTGFRPFLDSETGEWLADAVDDAAGAYDIDGDGFPEEINTGCERCHGPGSEHVLANATGQSRRYIVSVENLSPSRENMICGLCHDRAEGNGTVKNDHILNSDDEPPLPGISRADFLANYTSRKGPAEGSYWDDFKHSKSHHQHYPDLVKGKHYRNDRQFVVCSDCHDVHAKRTLDGKVEYPHNMTDDPDDPNSTLCMRCHALDPLDHMMEQTGATHAGLQTRCSDCHMPRAAKTGAGTQGLLLGTPTGEDSDVDIVYWMNDVSSHIFDFVSKQSLGVAGKAPGKAMPAPYTNRCGTCHDASQLPFLEPLPVTEE